MTLKSHRSDIYN